MSDLIGSVNELILLAPIACLSPPQNENIYMHLQCCGVGFYQVEIPVDETFESYSIFFIGTENSESLRNTLLHHPNSTGFVYDPLTSCCKKITLPVSK